MFFQGTIINLTGGLGGGKSYIAMMAIYEHLMEGGVVGCNFHLVDDWALQMAATHPRVLSGDRDVEEIARSLYSRCFLAGTPESIKDLTQNGGDLCVGSVADRFEKRVLFVLDEVGLYISPQTYRQNMPWLQLVTQARKLGRGGMQCLFLVQDISFVDTKVRKLMDIDARVHNLHENFKIPFTRIQWPALTWKPNLPRPSFALGTRSTRGGSSHYLFFRYRPFYGGLYNTHEVFDFDALPSVLEHQGVFPVLSPSEPVPEPEKSLSVRLSIDHWPSRRGRYWLVDDRLFAK